MSWRNLLCVLNERVFLAIRTSHEERFGDVEVGVAMPCGTLFRLVRRWLCSSADARRGPGSRCRLLSCTRVSAAVQCSKGHTKAQRDKNACSRALVGLVSLGTKMTYKLLKRHIIKVHVLEVVFHCTKTIERDLWETAGAIIGS